MKESPCVYENTYWNHRGKYPKASDALHKLIPAAGEVDNPDDNPALEEFRVACNLYYDLYNNGLCNESREFREVFGFSGPYFERDYDSDEIGEYEDPDWWTKKNVNRVEAVLNRLLVRAAKEQEVEL